jgi:hypothetical protein
MAKRLPPPRVQLVPAVLMALLLTACGTTQMARAPVAPASSSLFRPAQR